MSDKTTPNERQLEVAKRAENPSFSDLDFFREIMRRKDDSICEWYAIRAIGDLRDFKADKLLLEVLTEPDVKVGESSLHLVCARSIGRLGPEMLRKVAKLLDHPREETRIAAIDSLGELRHPGGIELLYPFLSSGSEKEVLWTTLSLAKIGKESIPVLKEAIESQGESTAILCFDALLLINGSKARDAIFSIFRKFPKLVKVYFKRMKIRRGVEFRKRLEEELAEGGEKRKQAQEMLSILET